MMKCYLGTKIIQAEPMKLSDYNNFKGWTMPDGEDPEAPGYLVKHSNNHTTWSPKDIFEIACRPITPDEAKLIVGDGAVFVVNQDKDSRELLAKGLESEGENHDKNT